MLPNKAIFLPNQMGKSSDPGLDFHPIWICHFSLRTRLDYQVTDSDGCGGPVTVPPPDTYLRDHGCDGRGTLCGGRTAHFSETRISRATPQSPPHFLPFSLRNPSSPYGDSLAEAKGHFRLENTLLEATGPWGPGDDRALGRPGGGLTGTAQETDWGALLLGGGVRWGPRGGRRAERGGLRSSRPKPAA